MKRHCESKATWLDLARRQSQLIASARSDRFVAFDWTAAQIAARKETDVTRLRRLLILLPAVLALGATATWAFVNHLERRGLQRTPVVKVPPTQPSAVMAPRASHRSSRPARVLPAASPVRKSTTSPKRQPPVRRPRAVTRPIRRDLPVPRGPEQVTVEDEVIIVVPPAKMRPLWTVDSYLRR